MAESLKGRSDLSSYHINSHLEDYESARSNYFTLVISGLNKLAKSDYDVNLGEPGSEDVIDEVSDIIRLSVDSVSVPHFSVGDISVTRGNSTVHFAGKPSFTSGKMTCRDFVGLKTKDALMAWQAKTYDVINDKGGRGADYKKDCTLIEYTQDHVEIRRWDIIGMFPTGVSESEFNKNDEKERQLDVDFVYDRAIMH